MQKQALICVAAATVILFTAGCQNNTPAPSISSDASADAGVSSSASSSITPEEGAALLEQELGTVDAATGNAMSYGYLEPITLDCVDYYRYRVSWLVDGDHMSYLTDYLVSTDGSIVKEYVPESSGASAETELESAADALLASMASGDFAAVADWAGDGTVAFTPYSTVDPSCDRQVTAAELENFATDTTVYTWGIYDGSGEDIKMTPKEYWDRFVWTADWTKAPLVSVNETHAGGNSPENVEDAYPACSYVEYYYDGIDPQFGGADWCALKLVFTNQNGGWQLCGIIHSEMTL
ncbi:MAG: hypothetical protein LKJ86_09935 [Oscillibacter sp.]|jgi:hypothetical protein|nr:hypothetical protein [Oscillibacter sp.]